MGQTLFMVSVHSYLTWGGELRIQVCRTPTNVKPWMPGCKIDALDEADARALLEGLQRALAHPPECIDCGSTMHSTDDPACQVANSEDNEC